MIRYRVEIQWLCQLYFKAPGVRDRFALSIAVGVRRCGGGAKSRCIERQCRMYMQIAEVGIAIRIELKAITVSIWQGGNEMISLSAGITVFVVR